MSEKHFINELLHNAALQKEIIALGGLHHVSTSFKVMLAV